MENKQTNKSEKGGCCGCLILVVLLIISATIFGVRKYTQYKEHKANVAKQEQQKKQETEVKQLEKNIALKIENNIDDKNIKELFNIYLPQIEKIQKKATFPIGKIKLDKVEYKVKTKNDVINFNNNEIDRFLKQPGEKIIILNISTNSTTYNNIKNDTASIVPYIFPVIFKNKYIDEIKMYTTATATKEDNNEKVTDEIANITFNKNQHTNFEDMKTWNYDAIFKAAINSGIYENIK